MKKISFILVLFFMAGRVQYAFAAPLIHDGCAVPSFSDDAEPSDPPAEPSETPAEPSEAPAEPSDPPADPDEPEEIPETYGDDDSDGFPPIAPIED